MPYPQAAECPKAIQVLQATPSHPENGHRAQAGAQVPQTWHYTGGQPQLLQRRNVLTWIHVCVCVYMYVCVHVYMCTCSSMQY